MEHFTDLRVILAQGPRESSLYRSSSSLRAAGASTRFLREHLRSLLPSPPVTPGNASAEGYGLVSQSSDMFLVLICLGSL